MHILLSVKPEFANKIFAGSKKYEYRKVIPKIYNSTTNNKVIVYSTMPVGMIVGEFFFTEILRDTPQNIWSVTEENSGISKENFFSYFSNVDIASAFVIKTFKKYKSPKKLCELVDFYTPPQSFRYVRNNITTSDL